MPNDAPVKLPHKIVGGWIRQAQYARLCACGCGEYIKRGAPYARVGGEAGKGHGAERKSTNKSLRLECWKRRLEERDPRKRILVRDPTRKPRASSYRNREVVPGVPSGVMLHLNMHRAKMLLEVMTWAGHDRPHAILYAMLDAGYERWRRRREAGVLPHKPPPLPPRHYGPHLLKVEGFE